MHNLDMLADDLEYALLVQIKKQIIDLDNKLLKQQSKINNLEKQVHELNKDLTYTKGILRSLLKHLNIFPDSQADLQS